MTSLWWDIVQTILVQSVLFSIAFVLGAQWHSWHLCDGCERIDEEARP
jgi:hypothetical protein